MKRGKVLEGSHPILRHNCNREIHLKMSILAKLKNTGNKLQRILCTLRHSDVYKSDFWIALLWFTRQTAY